MLATPSRRGPRVLHTYPKFYACYLLKSIHTPDSKTTYIGSTPDPPRRIRQHNGEISQGARKTARKRPWVMQMLVHGFPSRLAALQFEWAWQHPHKSRHFVDKDGQRLFGNRACTTLKKNIIIVRTMVAKHPFDTWPLKVKLFTPEAVHVWDTIPSAIETRFPLPPAFTCSVELEGVDGKSGPVGSGRTAGICVDDDAWSKPYLAKNVSVTATTRSPHCSLCHEPIQQYESDPLKSSLCPADQCHSVSHLTCLAKEFHRQNPQTTSLAPRGGHCPECHAYTLWGDHIRGCYRRHTALTGVDAYDSEDLFDSDSADNLDGEPTPKRSRSRKKTAVPTTIRQKSSSRSRSTSPVPAPAKSKPKQSAKSKGKQKATRPTSESDGDEDAPALLDFSAAKKARSPTPPEALVVLTDSDPESSDPYPTDPRPLGAGSLAEHSPSKPNHPTILDPPTWLDNSENGDSPAVRRKPGRPRKRVVYSSEGEQAVQREGGDGESIGGVGRGPSVFGGPQANVDGYTSPGGVEISDVFQDGYVDPKVAKGASSQAKPGNSERQRGRGRPPRVAPPRSPSPSPSRSSSSSLSTSPVKGHVPSKRLYHTTAAGSPSCGLPEADAAALNDLHSHRQDYRSGISYNPPATPIPPSSTVQPSRGPIPPASGNRNYNQLRSEPSPSGPPGSSHGPAGKITQADSSGEYIDVDNIPEYEDTATVNASGPQEEHMSLDMFVKTFKKQLRQTPMLKKSMARNKQTAKTNSNTAPTPSSSTRPLEQFPLRVPSPPPPPPPLPQQNQHGHFESSMTALGVGMGNLHLGSSSSPSPHHLHQVQVPTTLTRSRNNTTKPRQKDNNTTMPPRTTTRTAIPVVNRTTATRARMPARPPATAPTTTYSDLDEDDLYSRDTDEESVSPPAPAPAPARPRADDSVGLLVQRVQDLGLGSGDGGGGTPPAPRARNLATAAVAQATSRGVPSSSSAAAPTRRGTREPTRVIELSSDSG